MAPFEGSNDKKKQGGGQQKVIEKLATLGSPKTDSLIVWLSICNPAQPFGQKPVLLLWIFSSDPRILPFSIASSELTMKTIFMSYTIIQALVYDFFFGVKFPVRKEWASTHIVSHPPHR